MYSWSDGKLFYVFFLQKKAFYQAFVGKHMQSFLTQHHHKSPVLIKLTPCEAPSMIRDG